MAVILGLEGFAEPTPMEEDWSCCQPVKLGSRFLASVKTCWKHLQPILNSFLCPEESELLFLLPSAFPLK